VLGSRRSRGWRSQSLACDHPIAALPLVFLVGLTTNIPYAVPIKFCQDYLPTRPGTAAGVTLGLAVSAGGLLMPVVGGVADRHRPRVRSLCWR